MVAMVILLFVSMALFQTAIVSIDANARTMLRDEAVRLAEARMDELKNVSYPDGTNCAGLNAEGDAVWNTSRCIMNGNAAAFTNDPVYVPVRNMTMTYRMRAVIDTDSKTMDVTVFWPWKGESFTHQISTVRTD